MTLEDRRTACEEAVEHIRSSRDMLPSGSTILWEHAAAARNQLDDVMLEWSGGSFLAPEGDPDAVETSADGIGDVADTLDGLARDLERQAGEIESGMDAKAGTASAADLMAFAGLAGLEADGLDVLADGLDAYAGSLRAGQDAHVLGMAVLATAGFGGSVIDLPTADSTDDECVTVVDSITATYDAAESALGDVAGAFTTVIDAERALQHALGDADGYHRLVDLDLPSGVSTLDAILALVDGVDDPDHAIVSKAEWDSYIEQRGSMSAADRARLDAALDAARTPEERQVLISAVATGGGIEPALALAEALHDKTPAEVEAIARFGTGERTYTDLETPDGTDVKQWSGTTCGATTLLMLAAQRDPYLALLLAEGEIVDGHVPEFVADLPLVAGADWSQYTTEERLAYLQDQTRIRGNQFTGWPGSIFGSAPWGYGDEVERALGIEVDMQYSMTRGYDDPQQLVDDAIAAVDAGDPVPMMVGGKNDVWYEPETARHYVLLVAHEGDQLTFYEPTSGELHTISATDLVAGGDEVSRQLGWPELYGAAIPTG